MSRVFFSAAAILLLCAVASSARVLPEVEEDSTGGRLLLQSLDCVRLVHRGCNTCRNQRIKGTKKTETVCSTAKAGWRVVKNNNKACECAPGLYLNGTLTAGTCVSCPTGSYCTGGNGAKVQSAAENLGAAQSCDEGLATKFAGAKSVAQCFTEPGYGRKSVRGANGVITYEAVECPAGTYNVGGNTAGCQKCGAGLTTNSTMSDASSDCVAPAGSFLDKGVGKKCPKGTYTEGLNTASVCTPCADGVTTPGEGTTLATECKLAMKGYHIDATNPNAAVKCELHTFNAGETDATNCTACDNGWMTQDVGADGPALCLAPPGYAQPLVGGVPTGNIEECALNTYKEGWNRNPCVACGAEIVTNSTGSVSKDACLVKPGFGITTLTPLASAACLLNSYGDDVYRVAVASARCTPCPPKTFTIEQWNASAAPATGFTSEASCMVEAGTGMTETGVEDCQIGFYNEGQNRAFCTACPAGYTTLATKSTSQNDCVIKAGWRYDDGKALPAPCDKGSWSAGGNSTLREPLTCNSCAEGYTTQEQEAETVDECNVCAAGYGSTGAADTTCSRCPVNTFSSGGITVGSTCTACADGTVSSQQATESSQCFPEFMDLTRDYFLSSSNTSFVVDGTANSASACEANCKTEAACMQIRVSISGTVCERMAANAVGAATAVGDKTVSFKVKGGIDWARYAIDSAVNLGTSLGVDASGTTLALCEAACKPNGNCEGVMFDGTTCTLITSDLDADYTGFVHVVGTSLASYVA